MTMTANMTANMAVPGIDDQENAAPAPAKNTKNSIRHLVALDVDGTLVDHDGVMSEGVRAAANAVVEAGHEVIIATGRSLGAVLPIVAQVGLTRGYAVCSNGGVTLRLDPTLELGYEIINRETFSPRAALTTLREKIPGARFALEDANGNFLSTSRFQDSSFGIEARGVDFHHMLDTEAVRVVVNSADATTEEFSAAIEAAGLHGVAYAVGWSAWLDIAAAGVTKATALERLRAELEIEQGHTVAVGDGSNDIDMLRWAGRGVAMGQAEENVRAAANEITASVYDDGAAHVLRSLLA